MTEIAAIAERTLLVQQPNGERKKIVVRIGAPYWVTPGEEAACPVAIEGLYEELPDTHGVDPYQALELAIQLTQMLLAPSANQRVLWLDGKPYEVAAPPAEQAAQKGTRKRKRA